MLTIGKLPPLNPLYIQRNYDQNLEKLIKEKHTIVLCGALGTGRTQLARQFANRILRSINNDHEYEFLIWLVADQLDTLLSNCRQIGNALQIAGYEQLTDDELAEAIKRKLEERNCLVIIDDVCSEKVKLCIEKFLPDYSTDIVIISSHEDWDYYKLRIRQCTEQEAINIIRHMFIEKDIKIVSEEQIKRLVAHFEHNLVWTTQAANYIIENLGGEIDIYLKSNEKIGQPLKDFGLNSQQALLFTLENFQQITNNILPKDENLIALLILQICSLLPSQNIPITLLTHYFQHYAKVPERKLEQLINLLCKKTMLIEREGSYISMHCSYQTMFKQNILVKQSLISNAKLSDLQTCFFKFLVEKVKWRRSENVSPNNKFQWEQVNILPHVKSVIVHFEEQPEYSYLTIELYYAIGNYYENQELLYEAKSCYIKSRDLSENLLGKDIITELSGLSSELLVDTTKQSIAKKINSATYNLEQFKMYVVEILYKLASINIRLWQILDEHEKDLTIKYLEQSFHLHSLFINLDDVKAQDQYYTCRNLAASYKKRCRFHDAKQIIDNLINSDFTKNNSEMKSLAYLDAARWETKINPLKAIDYLKKSLLEIYSVAESDYSYNNRAKDMIIIYLELGYAYLEVARAEKDKIKKFDALKKADIQLRFALKFNREHYKLDSNRTAGRIFYYLAEVNEVMEYYFLAREAVIQSLLIQQSFYQNQENTYIKDSSRLLRQIEDKIQCLKDPPEEINKKSLQILQQELDKKKEEYNETNDLQALKEYADILLETNDPEKRDLAINYYQTYLDATAANPQKSRRASVYKRLGYALFQQMVTKSDYKELEEQKLMTKAAYKEAQMYYKDLLDESQFFEDDTIKFNYNLCFWALNKLEKSKLDNVYLIRNNNDLFHHAMTSALLAKYNYYLNKWNHNCQNYDKIKLATETIKTVAEFSPADFVKGMANIVQGIHAERVQTKTEQIIHVIESKLDPIKSFFRNIAKKISEIYIEQIPHIEPESIETFAKFISEKLFDYVGSKKVDFTLDPIQIFISGLYYNSKKNCLLTTQSGILWNAEEMLRYTGIITHDNRIYIYFKTPEHNLKYGFRHDNLPIICRHYEYHKNRTEAIERLKQLANNTTNNARTTECSIS
ncbi:5269_t:CDS:1 [Gigaspora margarita]|uniref:5269_t:CDS:1 n=1 Tax=Gigaspora margarita TaxID=4874 RepID=A0ABM8W693_GIGMA|nr:5269_t:CDS:1 [Gigaspora margarita]